MRKIAMVIAMVSLVGCNSAIFDTQVRKAVRAELTDPDSAVFEAELNYKDFACVRVNSKTPNGGFSGFRTVHLRRMHTAYEVKKWGAGLCNQESLKYMASD